MKFRVPALLLVTTGIVSGVVLTNDLAVSMRTDAAQGNVHQAVAATPLLSAISAAEASEATPTVQPEAVAQAEAPVAAPGPAANMTCREAAWPYVQRRCETPAEKKDQVARHVRVISLDRGSPNRVSVPSVAVQNAERTDSITPSTAQADMTARTNLAASKPGGNVDGQGTSVDTSVLANQSDSAGAAMQVTTLPPARPELTAQPETVTAAAQPDTTPAASAPNTIPAPHAAPAVQHKVRTARHSRHEPARYVARRDDGGSLDPGLAGFDERPVTRTTVTYGYRDPAGHQYYYRYGAGGRRQDLAYSDYPPPPPGYAYDRRRPAGGGLFGWLGAD